jgi:hypothetical protein
MLLLRNPPVHSSAVTAVDAASDESANRKTMKANSTLQRLFILTISIGCSLTEKPVS